MKFTVYSKRGCPYCTKIIKVLELSELDHKVYKLDEHFDKSLRDEIETYYQHCLEDADSPFTTSNLGEVLI